MTSLTAEHEIQKKTSTSAWKFEGFVFCPAFCSLLTPIFFDGSATPLTWSTIFINKQPDLLEKYLYSGTFRHKFRHERNS